jgi:hypothetical protein
MEKTAEQVYTDMLQAIGSPSVVEPAVLLEYLRELERMHSMGHITAWQLERAKEAYEATLDRDPRQRPGAGRAAGAPVLPGSANVDPISGTPGAHPFGTGVGAALGGAAAGAAIGTVVGPVGTVIGASVGAIIGGLAGKGVAELIDPTVEQAYWRTEFTARPYVEAGSTFEDYAPAYAMGVSSYQVGASGSFNAHENRMAAEWENARGASTLDWERARPAVRDAWERVGQRR